VSSKCDFSYLSEGDIESPVLVGPRAVLRALGSKLRLVFPIYSRTHELVVRLTPTFLQTVTQSSNSCPPLILLPPPPPRPLPPLTSLLLSHYPPPRAHHHFLEHWLADENPPLGP